MVSIHINFGSQMRETNTLVQRIGPEKGVIHLASAAVDNALWDMYARSRKKPLWKLIVDMTPVRYFHSSGVQIYVDQCWMNRKRSSVRRLSGISQMPSQRKRRCSCLEKKKQGRRNGRPKSERS